MLRSFYEKSMELIGFYFAHDDEAELRTVANIHDHH